MPEQMTLIKLPDKISDITEPIPPNLHYNFKLKDWAILNPLDGTLRRIKRTIINFSPYIYIKSTNLVHPISKKLYEDLNS